MSTESSPPRSGGAPSATVVDWALLVLPGFIWGASYLFIAEGLTAIRPEGITFVRTTIGFAVLSFLPGTRRPIVRTDRGRVWLLALLWLAFPMSMFPFAEQRVSSALTGMLNGATPLFTALVAATLVRRRPGNAVIVALAVGLGGSFLIALPTIGEGRSSAVGVGLITAALISYGFALNLAGPLQQRNGALPVIWRAVGAAMVMTAPVGFRAVLDAEWHLSAVLALLALGAFGTGIANVLVATAAGRGGATRASSMGFIIPTVSLGLGVFVRHEHVRLVAIIGGVVCMLGAWLLAKAPRLAASVTPTVRDAAAFRSR